MSTGTGKQELASSDSMCFLKYLKVFMFLTVVVLEVLMNVELMMNNVR